MVQQPGWVRRAAEEEAERLAAFFTLQPKVIWQG
jgi:hypothetical protein